MRLRRLESEAVRDAILAASGERGISRERLLLFLWPESDARHGRNTLNQTLYALRRDLGTDELVMGTSVLALNRATDASRSGDSSK